MMFIQIQDLNLQIQQIQQINAPYARNQQEMKMLSDVIAVTNGVTSHVQEVEIATYRRASSGFVQTPIAAQTMLKYP